MKKYIAIAALAFALVMGMTIAPASAYFTDQHTANGGVPVAAGPTTHIYEWVKGTQKKLVVTNDEDSVTVVIRAKAEHPSFVDASLGEGSSSKWVAGADGWYVYQDAVAAKGETEPLVFDFDFGRVETELERAPEDGNNYNIVVLYEAKPATYTAEGDLDFGDWK